MANNVDRRVLEMRFDNRDFQKNVGDTLISLETLQKALNSTENQKGTEKVKKGLLGISKAANSIDTQNVANGIDNISNRFSTLGIIGMGALQRVGYSVAELGFKLKNYLLAPLNIINEKGKQRALTIEQARFQLKGLGLDVEEVMKNANDAVDGTAYGLDEAAKAASVLGASGIKAGTEMTDVLTSIAGAAAMTGRSYSDIADIYSTVASNGKLMTQQIRQFSASGLNVSAVLAKAFDKTEEEINDMVSKGEISFKEFSEAMMDFGKHAKSANDTFSGSLSNLKAALGRIGASFYQPMLEHATDIFNALTKSINNVHNALKPLFAYIDQIATVVTKDFVGAISDLNSKFDIINKIGIRRYGDEWTKWKEILNKTDDNIKATTDDLKALGGKAPEALTKLAKHYNASKSDVEKMLEKGKISVKEFESITGHSIKMTGDNIKELQEKGVPALDILSKHFDITQEEINKKLKEGEISWTDFTKAAKKYPLTIEDVNKMTEKGIPVIGMLSKSLDVSRKKVREMLAEGKISYADFAEAIQKSVKDSLGDGTTSIKEMAMAIGGPLARNMKNFEDIAKAGKDIIGLFKDAIKGLFDVLGGGGGESALMAAANTMLDFVAAISRGISKLIELGRTSGTFSKIHQTLLNINDILFGFIENLHNWFGILKSGFSGISEMLESILDPLLKMFSSATAFLSGKASEGLALVSEGLGKLFSLLGKGGSMLSKITPIFQSLSTALFTFGGLSVMAAIKNLVNLINSITNSNLRLNGIKGLFSGLKKPLETLTKTAVGTDSFSTLNKDLTILKSTLMAYQMSIKAGALLLIASAILELSIAVQILSTIPTGKLMQAIVAIGVLMQMLSKSSMSMNAIESGGFIKLSITIHILASAVKKLGSLKASDIAKGVIAIGLLMQMLVKMNMYMRTVQGGEPGKAAFTLILYAEALRLMVKPIKKIGEMNLGDIAKGVGAVAITLLILAKTAKSFSGFNSGSLLKAAGSMILFGIAINEMILPIKLLGGMDLGSLGKGLVAIGIIMLEMAGLAELVSSNNKMGFDMIMVGTAMMGVAQAMVIISAAIAIMGNTANAGTGFAIMTASLVVLAFAVNAMKEALPGAAAIIIVAAALMIMAPAISLLSSLDLNGVLVGLIGVAGALIIFGVAAEAFLPVIPAMIGLAAVIALFGVGVLAAGAGLLFLASAFATGTTSIIEGLKAISEALPEIANGVADFFIVLLQKFIEAMPLIVQAIGVLISAAIIAISANTQKIVVAGLNLIIALLVAIKSKIGEITELALEIITIFVNTLGDNIGTLIDAGFNLIVNFINGLANALVENAPILKSAMENLLLSLLEAIVTFIPGIGKAGAKAIDKFRQGLDSGGKKVEKTAKKTGESVEKGLKVDPKKATKGAKDTMDSFTKEIDNAGKKSKTSSEKASKDVRDGLKKYMSESKGIGQNTGQGFVDGLNAKVDAAYRAGYAVGAAGARGEKDGAGVHSPSWKGYETGMYLVAGFINGMLGSERKANKAANNIATEVVGSYNSALHSLDSISGPSFSSSITKASEVNLRMAGVEKENQKLYNGINSLTKQLSYMTETMNSRSLNNYITVDGASDPNAFADDLIRSFRLKARTV